MTSTELSRLAERVEAALAAGETDAAMEACGAALSLHHADLPSGEADILLRSGINLGANLARAGKLEDAIDVFEEVLETLGDRQEGELQLGLALAGLNHARAIGMSGSPREGEKAALDAAARHETNEDPQIRVVTVKALNLAARFAADQGEGQRADAYHNAVLALLGDADLPDAEPMRAAALCQALYRMDPAADAAGLRAAVTDFLNRYEGAEHPDIRRNLREARLLLCQVCEAEGDFDAAIALYRRNIEELARAGGPDILALLSHAEVNLGRLYGRQNMQAEALAIFAALVDRFRDTPDMAVRQNVVDALYLSACLHAGNGKVQETVASLALAADQAGGIDPAMLDADPNFAAVREDPQFRTLLEALSKAELDGDN